MKRLIILLLSLFILTSCHRETCPAYMNGAATGTEGSRDKGKGLFPKEMEKKHKH